MRAAVKNARPNKGLMVKTVKVSLPAGFQYSLVYLSSIVLQRMVNGFGSDVIGAFTATTQMEILVEQVYTSLGAAMMTYTGQNVGAGKVKRVSEGLQAALVVSTIVSVAAAVVFWIFGHPIMGIFVNHDTMISIAATGIRITSSFFIALGAVQILRFLLSGAGDAGFTLVNGIVEIAVRITLVFLLTGEAVLGKWGIWFTTGFTWLATALFALWRYKGGKWKSKSLTKN